jgi:hypothetical protein
MATGIPALVLEHDASQEPARVILAPLPSIAIRVLGQRRSVEAIA